MGYAAAIAISSRALLVLPLRQGRCGVIENVRFGQGGGVERICPCPPLCYNSPTRHECHVLGYTSVSQTSGFYERAGGTFATSQ